MPTQVIKDTKLIIEHIGENLETITPHEISDFTVRLAIGYGNLGHALADAEAAYAKEWLEMRETCKTNAETDKMAKASDAYREKRRLDYAVKGLKETIQALKKRQQVMSDEANMHY